VDRRHDQEGQPEVEPNPHSRRERDRHAEGYYLPEHAEQQDSPDDVLPTSIPRMVRVRG